MFSPDTTGQYSFTKGQNYCFLMTMPNNYRRKRAVRRVAPKTVGGLHKKGRKSPMTEDFLPFICANGRFYHESTASKPSSFSPLSMVLETTDMLPVPPSGT